MNGSNFRSQLRTNVPGYTVIAGRFIDAAGGPGASTSMTIVEGKKFLVERTATGAYKITLGTSSTNLTPMKGLISIAANAVVATPGTAANNRHVQILSILNTAGTAWASGDALASVTVSTIDKDGVVASLVAADGLAFSCVVRDTEILV